LICEVGSWAKRTALGHGSIRTAQEIYSHMLLRPSGGITVLHWDSDRRSAYFARVSKPLSLLWESCSARVFIFVSALLLNEDRDSHERGRDESTGFALIL
jgi:hypothetical protein